MQHASRPLGEPPLLVTPTTVHGATVAARSALEARGVPEHALEAAILLAGTIRRSRAWIAGHGDDPLSSGDQMRYLAAVERRCRREPTAYILGEKQWLDISLEVNRNVLIPRPETELLAQEARSLLAALSHEGTTEAVAVDVGTGSGALAIALARHVPRARVTGVDVSAGALRLARSNARRLDASNAYFVLGSLLEPRLEIPDLVVANLPYVPSAEIDRLEPELAYEPSGALDGGPDGLDLIRALVLQAKQMLTAPSWLLLECGSGQAQAVARMLRASWPDGNIRIARDLAGIERVIVAELV